MLVPESLDTSGGFGGFLVEGGSAAEILRDFGALVIDLTHQPHSEGIGQVVGQHNLLSVQETSVPAEHLDPGEVQFADLILGGGAGGEPRLETKQEGLALTPGALALVLPHDNNIPASEVVVEVDDAGMRIPPDDILEIDNGREPDLERAEAIVLEGESGVHAIPEATSISDSKDLAG